MTITIQGYRVYTNSPNLNRPDIFLPPQKELTIFIFGAKNASKFMKTFGISVYVLTNQVLNAADFNFKQERTISPLLNVYDFKPQVG